MPKNIIRNNLVIAFTAALLFVPFLGGVHLFDWDEINFAESAREMIATGDYLTVRINFIPFWEKPPLFIWMQVLSMKIFGINEFAARFPNALCGIVTLLVLFNAGRKIKDEKFGMIWVLLYAGSFLPFIYFKSGIIDPWFNLFIFLGIFIFHSYFTDSKNQLLKAVLSAFFIGLAVLTKGPVALLIFLIVFGLFLLLKKFRVRIRVADVFAFVAVLAITGGFWFILQIAQGNFSIIADFIVYQIRLFKTQDAGHGGFLLYHFVVLFFGVFPASMFALPALFPSKYRNTEPHAFYLWMLILFWVVLILFTIVRTKIVHYSSLCYFPLTFLATWALFHFEESFKGAWSKVTAIFIGVSGIVTGIIIFLLSFFDSWKGWLIQHIKIRDPFAIANLSANGSWKGFEFITGILLIAAVLVFVGAWKKQRVKAVYFLTLSVSVFMFLALILIVPRVESYSQKTAIEFFQSVSNEDAYLATLGYKSYAHLFYGKAKDHNGIESSRKEWLLTGDIDRPAYFAAKINRKEKLIKEYPGLQFLYEKNGFVFFTRKSTRN
ncbi:MAG TPA: glycosyltransferase family 39 protein [Bacteroidales bacterium]|nr:glycosyltransferase family 39 protein [Bacteroidales bacterium]